MENTNFITMVEEAIATKAEYQAAIVACFETENGKEVVSIPEWMEDLKPNAWKDALYDLFPTMGKLLWVGNEPFEAEE